MKTINKAKYIILFLIFSISVLINFTYVKQERNRYENEINRIRTDVEQLRKSPGNWEIIMIKEEQLAKINNDSFWINIQYFVFIMILATLAAIIFSTLGQWGYTNVEFTRKKLQGDDGKIDNNDTENYSRVLAAVFLGICIIIAEAIRVAFGM